jgi:short-subunit dehydrogenase
MSRASVGGRRALVTGASSGLGAEIARQLAGRGCHLTLVARREDRLRTLREEIAAGHDVEVDVIPLDLTAPGAADRLYDRLERGGPGVDVLVNGAGYGLYGEFLDLAWERERNMLELDVVVPVQLTKLFARAMVGRGFGRVLHVSSIGAYLPSPGYASYAAAKTFVLQFAQALSYELRGTNVRCTVLVPGPTATEFFSVAGQQPSRYQRLLMMPSADVARIGVESLLAGKPCVVAGRANAFMAGASRFTPGRLGPALIHRLMTVR